jgi:hypothetical protein
MKTPCRAFPSFRPVFSGIGSGLGAFRSQRHPWPKQNSWRPAAERGINGSDSTLEENRFHPGAIEIP